MGLKYDELHCVLFTTLCLLRYSSVDAISNTQFNANIREYSVNEDNNNATNLEIKTLQKKETGKYSTFGPAGRSSIVFKEIPDNALSSSSHSRGLLHHHDHGYVLAEYDEIPPYVHGHEYPVHIPDHHQPHVFDTHYVHHDSDHHHYSSPHHLDHGHHYKHHALAAKTLLWPIAGIALLGAAAALVTNPVLLQLGVVSGKRRRRDTDLASEPDLINRFEQSVNNKDNNKINERSVTDIDTTKVNYKERMLRWKLFKDIKHNKRTAPSNISIRTVKDVNHYRDDDRFIPVPLKIKHP